jgi:hypothetical protein
MKTILSALVALTVVTAAVAPAMAFDTKTFFDEQAKIAK